MESHTLLTVCNPDPGNIFRYRLKKRVLLYGTKQLKQLIVQAWEVSYFGKYVILKISPHS